MITADFVDGADGAEMGFGSSVGKVGVVVQSALRLMPGMGVVRDSGAWMGVWEQK